MSGEDQAGTQLHMESELETMDISGGNALGSLPQSLIEGGAHRPQRHQGHLLAARMRLAAHPLQGQGLQRQDTQESRRRSYSVPTLRPQMQGPEGQANVASFLRHIGDEYNEARSPTRRMSQAADSQRRNSFDFHPGSAPTSEPRSVVSAFIDLVRKMSGAGNSDNC